MVAIGRRRAQNQVGPSDSVLSFQDDDKYDVPRVLLSLEDEDEKASLSPPAEPVPDAKQSPENANQMMRSVQNREAQRSFRARRQAYVQELEERVSHLDSLTTEVTRLSLRLGEQVTLLQQMRREQAAQGILLRQLLLRRKLPSASSVEAEGKQALASSGLCTDSPDPMWSALLAGEDSGTPPVIMTAGISMEPSKHQ